MLGERPDTQLVAASDNNSQGDVFADRLRALAQDVGCSYRRLRQAAEDWNDVVKQSGRFA
ncbi:toprim domain-containing protein [Rhizobium sp. Rhizsp42]|uniref:toprim domain-containing protein n=1 Tax=Rhizobium sp. Rhizsp42 TaxID=3243034 RepID=UPI0039AFBE13